MEIAGPGSVKRDATFPRQGDFYCQSEGGTLSPPNAFFLAQFECTGLKEEINCLSQSICQGAGHNFDFGGANVSVFPILNCASPAELQLRLTTGGGFQITA
jgi:hypothetical protein